MSNRRLYTLIYFGKNFEKFKTKITYDIDLVVAPFFLKNKTREIFFTQMKSLGFKRFENIFYRNVKIVENNELTFTRTKNKLYCMKDENNLIISTSNISEGFEKRYELNEISNIFSREGRVIFLGETHILNYEENLITIKDFKDAWRERGEFTSNILDRSFRFYFKGIKCEEYKSDNKSLLVKFIYPENKEQFSEDEDENENTVYDFETEPNKDSSLQEEEEVDYY